MKSLTTLLPTLAALFIAACGTGNAAEPAARESGADGRGDDTALHATGDTHRYTAEEGAECSYAPSASIYGVSAQMWLVQHHGRDDGQSLSLTLWRPASGAADQLSLHVSSDGRSSRISTVQGGEIAGSARITLKQHGTGGTITVEGRDAAGDRVDVTVRCASFDPLEAVGG
ncbi:MAG TPA: hypothetical protein VHG09_00530 [Longimicrobiales bacterium]|nr:hypothetical protein [Longimicrobiales bacterium]